MSNFTMLLQKIKENINYYLEKPSLTCLDSFLRGYLMAQEDMGLEILGADFSNFHTWLQEKLELKTSRSWLAMVLFYSGSERRALYDFLDLFKEFEAEEKFESADSNYSRNSEINEDLYVFIKRLRQRPAMYLGTSSITRLYMLLKGYDYARREAGVPLTAQEQDFLQFQEWIQTRFDIHSSQAWDKIILFYSIDEEEALNNFFGLLDEFLNRQM